MPQTQAINPKCSTRNPQSSSQNRILLPHAAAHTKLPKPEGPKPETLTPPTLYLHSLTPKALNPLQPQASSRELAGGYGSHHQIIENVLGRPLKHQAPCHWGLERAWHFGVSGSEALGLRGLRIQTCYTFCPQLPVYRPDTRGEYLKMGPRNSGSPKPQILSPKPQTLNPKTLRPPTKPETLKP